MAVRRRPGGESPELGWLLNMVRCVTLMHGPGAPDGGYSRYKTNK